MSTGAPEGITSTEPDDPGIAYLREALHAPELRIELSIAFLGEGGVQPCAFLYVKNDRGRWMKAPGVPLLLPDEGGNRGDLLQTLAKFLLADK